MTICISSTRYLQQKNLNKERKKFSVFIRCTLTDNLPLLGSSWMVNSESYPHCCSPTQEFCHNYLFIV